MTPDSRPACSPERRIRRGHSGNSLSRPSLFADALRPLRAAPWPLFDALTETPVALLHGDTKFGNLGSRPDGRTILSDHEKFIAWGDSCCYACAEICPSTIIHRVGQSPEPELVESSEPGGATLVSIRKSRCGSGAALHPMSTRMADTQMELRKDATWHIHHE